MEKDTNRKLSKVIGLNKEKSELGNYNKTTERKRIIENLLVHNEKVENIMGYGMREDMQTNSRVAYSKWSTHSLLEA